MAYYHLTVKTDTKPDGSKIIATDKVAYNNREGKYENIDEERMAAHDIFQETIYSSNPIENFPMEDQMLYESPFGSIKRIPTGEIKVSRGASVETVAIAMTLVRELYKGEIEIDGSDNFKARCLHTSADLELNINFKNQDLESKVNQLKEEKDYVRRNLKQGQSRRTRERQLKRRGIRKRSSFPRQFVLHAPEYPGEFFTRTTNRLPDMSKRNVDVLGGKAPMLVQGNSRLHVRHEPKQENEHPIVRWSLSRARRNRIEESAKQIIENIQTNADKTYAASHLQYINREAAFKKRGGIVGGGCQLPLWANNDAKVFFEEADKYAPKNDERYKEIEFALPNELTLDQQKKLIQKFLDLHLKDHYYAYAIHNKVGTLDSTGQEHPHVHIMFSNKLIDQRERENERPPELFFKKHNPDYPERGGPKKDDLWNNKNRREHLCRVRESYAILQNEALREAGIPIRVDHRTKEAQYKEAVEHGFVTLAKLLEIMPEKYINMTDMLNQDSKDFKDKQKFRDYKADYIRKLQAADHLERLIKEEETRERVQTAKYDFSEIVSESDEDGGDDTGEIRELKKRVIGLLNQEVNLHGLVLREADAITQAQISLMFPEEKKLFAAYRDLKEQKRGWQNCKSKLKKPPAFQLEEVAIYEKLVIEIDNAISTINKKILEAEKEPVLRDAFIRLSTKAYEKKVWQAKLNLMNENKPIRDKYYKICDEIDEAMRELQDHLEKHEEKLRNDSYEKEYTGEDLLNALYKERKILRNHLRKLQKSLADQEKKVFSLERAEAMAKDRFVKGDFKKLREEFRKLRKREGYYDVDLKKLDELRISGDMAAVPKEEVRLAQMKEENDSTRQKLETWQADLDRRCSEPKAVEKIAEITKGILNKNQGEKKRRDYLVRKVSEVNEKIKEIDKKISGLRKSFRDENPKKRFKVADPKSIPDMPLPRMEAPSIITNALLGDEYCAGFVYRNKDDDIHKEWELMTEAEKDEARMKRAYRDDDY